MLSRWSEYTSTFAPDVADVERFGVSGEREVLVHHDAACAVDVGAGLLGQGLAEGSLGGLWTRPWCARDSDGWCRRCA